MSGNSSPAPRKPDPRAAHTRERLGDALLGLLLVRPFDDITVQSVLDRAGVSRSTFYEHYRDKNDLLLSDVDEFFQAMSTLLERRGDRSGRVAPVAELFSHIAASRELFAALVASGKLPEVRELGEAHFARSIARRLAPPTRGRQPPSAASAHVPLAHALAGALFSLLAWWVRQGMTIPPSRMERLFDDLAASHDPSI